MKVLLRGTVFTALCSALLSFSAPSVGQSPAVETELIAEVRQALPSVQGTTAYRFVRATVVAQGQVVYYTVKVRNPSATAYVRDVMVEQKIPENTEYVAGSAAGPAVEVSLSMDGGRTYVLERKALGSRRQPGEPNPTYTHIRWRFRNALAPGAAALVRFRAIFR